MEKEIERKMKSHRGKSKSLQLQSSMAEDNEFRQHYQLVLELVHLGTFPTRSSNIIQLLTLPSSSLESSFSWSMSLVFALSLVLFLWW